MSLEKIVERIERESQNIGAQILKEGRDKEKEIIELAHKEAGERHNEIIKKAEEKAFAVKNNMLAQARLEQRKAVLKTKQEILSHLYQGIFKEIISLPVESYQKLINKIILDTVESGEGEIFISPNDKERITAEFILGVNKELKKRKKKGELKLFSQQVSIEGGFILRQGKTEIDNSFNTLHRVVREETEEEVTRILFGVEK